MKRYICFKCIAFGGKDPCVLACKNDLEPTRCPHDDSKYPNAHWELDASQHSIEADAEDLCILENPCSDDTPGDCPDDCIYRTA